jgi:hypothetical protein
MMILLALLLLQLLAQLLFHFEGDDNKSQAQSHSSVINNGSDDSKGSDSAALSESYQVINVRHRHKRTAAGVPSFDCWSFLSIFQHKMNGCHRKNQQHMVLVYACTIFRGEVDAIISFIVYHLSLGVNHITVYYYSSDGRETAAATRASLPIWFNHPTLTCLRRHGLITLVERSSIRRVRSAVSSDHIRDGLRDDYGHDDDGDRVFGDHCFSEDHLSSWKVPHAGAAAVAWGAVLLLHDMVTLSRRLKCIGELFYNSSSASLVLHTHSFLPDEEEEGDVSASLSHLSSSSLSHPPHSLSSLYYS